MSFIVGFMTQPCLFIKKFIRNYSDIPLVGNQNDYICIFITINHWWDSYYLSKYNLC